MYQTKSRGQLTVLNNNEIWKPIVKFEDRYEVSSLGRVRSLQDNHGKDRINLKKLSLSWNKQYLQVQLFHKNKNNHRLVHRLVAEAFIPNPDSKPYINHIDGNKFNNHVSNLEWCTQQENVQHAYNTGLNPSNANSIKGNKSGLSSNYHNVTWDKSRNKWKASLKDKQKLVFQKRFDSENEAAIYVNNMLDFLGYSDRPRNIII